MGIFDGVLDLFAGSPEKQVQRHGKRVRSKDAQQEDRQASIHWLADQGTPMAIYAMLGRYEMTYEHQMKDEGEKELVGELLLGLGETARDPLEKFIPQSKSFARPLAIYQQLFGEDAARTLTLAMLAEELKKSAFKITRKRSILIKLAEFQSPEVLAITAPLLDEFDEGVRYAAAEVCIAQPDSEEIRGLLLSRMAHPEEESNRLRVRIAEIASTRRWSLGEHLEALAKNPPHGWSVEGGQLRPAR